MKALLILLIFVCLFFSLSISAYDEYTPIVKVVPPEPETVKVHLKLQKDSVIFLPANFTDTTFIKDNSVVGKWYDDLLKYIAPIGILITFIVYRLTKKNKSYDFIFDLNKILIDKPELWYIYDEHHMHININKIPNFSFKLKAMCYYIINNYDLIYSNRNFIFRWFPKFSITKRIMRSPFVVWSNFIKHLIEKSSNFRFTLYQITCSEKSDIYTEKFIVHLKLLILEKGFYPGIKEEIPTLVLAPNIEEEKKNAFLKHDFRL